MADVLIISGPTAVGKTALALDLAKKLNGELVSADSRQVYSEIDIITGKDIPPGWHQEKSHLSWHGRKLLTYTNHKESIWLYDIVGLDEQFNLSFWNQCARLVIVDILSRNKLPIVVGATGLYIKSLLFPLEKIDTPPNTMLRKKLESAPLAKLQKQLQKIDPLKYGSLNHSDLHNPRRLIRAIEISGSSSSHPTLELFNIHHLTLSSPTSFLYPRIDKRVLDRITNGAQQEASKLLNMFDTTLPSMQISGLKIWPPYLANQITHEELVSKWQFAEHKEARHQLVWFNKLPVDLRIDISTTDPLPLALSWYNNLHEPKS